MVSLSTVSTALLLTSAATASTVDLQQRDGSTEVACIDLGKALSSVDQLVVDLLGGLGTLLENDAALINHIVSDLEKAAGAIDVGCLLSDVGELGGELVNALVSLLTKILGAL